MAEYNPSMFRGNGGSCPSVMRWVKSGTLSLPSAMHGFDC